MLSCIDFCHKPQFNRDNYLIKLEAKYLGRSITNKEFMLISTK